MKVYVGVTRDEAHERPVPTEWRKTFFDIIEAFRAGDFKIDQSIPCVQSLSAREAERIAGNIKSYGSQLISLPEESWNRSVCRWMGEYWHVLVDLFVSEGLSDLVLFARVYDVHEPDSRDCLYEFHVESVHVP
jgi:hypothetical protein